MPDPRELAEAIAAANSICAVAPSLMRPAKPRPIKPLPGPHPQNSATKALLSAYQQSRWSLIPPDAPERLARAARASATRKAYWAAYRADPSMKRTVGSETRAKLSLVQQRRWSAAPPGSPQRAAFAQARAQPLAPETRERMSISQSARWAAKPRPAKAPVKFPKHIISAGGRERIAAAQKERWAAFRAKQGPKLP